MTLFTIYLLISGICFPFSLVFVVKWFCHQHYVKKQVQDIIKYEERSEDNASERT